MKNENMNWNTARRIVLVILGIFSLFMLGACSDGSGEGGSSRTLVTRYSYNLTRNATYYYVNEFHCYDNGDNTYDVVSASIHYFSKTNDSYKNRTGQELIDMVRTNSVSPSSTKKQIQSQDATRTSTNSTTNVKWTFNIPAGTNCTINYYF